MRILMTTLLMGATLAGAPGAATAANPAASQDANTVALLKAEADACKAFEDGNADALRKALTPDFTLVDSCGNVTDLEQNLAEVAAREPYYDEFRNDGQRVRLYGDDTALIVGVTHIRGKAGGEAFAADFRYTDTWIRRDGRWRLAASHASRLPDAAAAP